MNMKFLLESFKKHMQLLDEIKMEQVLPRFESKAFIKAVDELNRRQASENPTLYQMIGAKTPQKIKSSLEMKISRDINQKYKPEALNWLITYFIRDADGALHSTLENDLKTFYEIKEEKMDKILSKNDIYSISDKEELKDIIQQATPAWQEYKTTKAENDPTTGIDKIYEDKNWEVFIPQNRGAACSLGTGTKWCTARRDVNYYAMYHKPPNDPLIIFISKSDPTEKYQLSYGSQQFKDRDEQPIQQKPIWYILNNIVAKISSRKIPNHIKEKALENAQEQKPETELSKPIKESKEKYSIVEKIIREEIYKILEEERKLGKPSSETNLGDWFKRKGAPGKKGGWVDCNTCRDGKCKPCGRQEGEKRSKYPRCRPTPSQCKGYKRRGSNLQKEE